MSRLLVAAAVAVTGIVALPRESTPDVTGAPALTRLVPHRASRSVRRHPLPHPRRRRRRHLVTVTPTPTATPALVTAAHDWTGVAQCESGGNWSIDTGNGFYGGLQFTLTTWHAFGGVGMPNDATEAEQISVAERVLAIQGVGAWPICGRYLRGAA